MKNQDISQPSEACLPLKKKLLTSVWEDFNPLLSEVSKLSRHLTEEDDVLELSRSELLFVALLQALKTRDAVMSGRLLLEVDHWKVLPRLSFYLGHKLQVELNCPDDFFSSAAEFAHTLKTCGLFRVPNKLLEFLDHLAECMRKVIENRSLRTQEADVRQDFQREAGSIQGESGSSNKAKRRDNGRKRNSKINQQVTQMANLSLSQSSIPSITSALPEVACSEPSTSLRPWSPSDPRLIIVRPRKEVEAATEALSDVLGTKNVSAMLAAIWNGADVERKYSGSTPLHFASHHGHLKVVKLLLDLGVDVEAVNYRGDRPLHIAARMGRNAVITKLVKAGANLHSIGNSDRTPLQVAIHNNRHSTINLLFSLGARQ